LTEARGCSVRTSLARTAALLSAAPITEREAGFAEENTADFNPEIEATSWGPGLRMKPPVLVEGAALRWDLPATSLGSSPPAWQ
jgi:hypothetical protein